MTDNKPHGKKVVKHQESPRNPQLNQAGRTNARSGYRFLKPNNPPKPKK